MIYDSHSDIDALGYDRVLEEVVSSTKKVTYVMRLDPAKYKSGNAESLPIWQIKRITETVVDTITITKIEYPKGSNGYVFKANDYLTLSYSYRNC